MPVLESMAFVATGGAEFMSAESHSATYSLVSRVDPCRPPRRYIDLDRPAALSESKTGKQESQAGTDAVPHNDLLRMSIHREMREIRKGPGASTLV